MNVVTLSKTGKTSFYVIDSCTNNLNGIDVSSNLNADKASERWNEDLQAYVFSEEDYNMEMKNAMENKLF